MRVTSETFVALAALQCLSAYTIPTKVSNTMIKGIHRPRGVSRLYSSTDSPNTPAKSQKLLRLNAMAAKLRAEASELEVNSYYLV
jgi:hypothetical protein